MAVEYWQEIADLYGWKYTYYDAGQNYGKAVMDTHDGVYDVLIGNFSTYYERGKLVDFSRPYLLNYISVLTTTKNTRGLFEVFLSKVTGLVLPVIISLMILVILFSILLSKNNDLTRENGVLSNAFYVLITVLQGQLTFFHRPHITSSRIIVAFIVLFSVVFTATVTSVMTNTVFALDAPYDPFNKLSDIKGKKFIIEEGGGFVSVVKSLGGLVTEIPGSHESFEHYNKNKDKYDGVVADHALVNLYDKEIPDKDIIQSQINIQNDELVFIFNKDNPYKKQVNLGILKLQDNNTSKLICAKYLGVDSKLCII